MLVSGLMAGFLSGLLGLGGGILLTPVLLYAHGPVGLNALAVKEITGLTMVQGLAGAVAGLARHHSFGYVDWRLVRYMGVSVGGASLLGALLSRSAPDGLILAVFGVMASVAAALVFLPGPRQAGDEAEPQAFAFSIPRAVVSGALVGLAGGLVGQAGSFLLIPLMVYVLRVPTRFAIGSNLGIILFSAVAGLAGKLGTAQVPLLLTIPLLAGGVPASQVGALVSRRTRPRLLRQILAGIVALAAVGIWVDLFV